MIFERFEKKDKDIAPKDFDLALSVVINKKSGRPIYYIIMNPDLEYEVYGSAAFFAPLGGDGNVQR